MKPSVPVAPGAPVSPQNEPPKSGILNIDKPGGMTSHDVVQAVRRASGVRRVGHAGTLDPLATGVLLVCLGSATRVIDELQDCQKSYRARVLLGVATSTFDAEGDVTESCDASGVSRAQVEAALSQFRGLIQQVPPMHSAIRHKGRRLYDLARAGIEVQRAPRDITVHHIGLTEWAPPELTLEMRVSKGTYVRSIAHDLGCAVGVGAHLAGLVRTAVGRFSLADAEPLDRVVDAFQQGWWPLLVAPLDVALLGHPAIVVDDVAEAAIRHGRQIAGPAPDSPAGRRVRAYSAHGQFIGLLRWDDVTEQWQPDRIFPRGT